MAPANLSFSASLGSIASATSHDMMINQHSQPFMWPVQLGGSAPWKCTEIPKGKDHLPWFLKAEKIPGMFFGIRKFLGCKNHPTIVLLWDFGKKNSTILCTISSRRCEWVANKLITSTCSRLVHLPFSCLQINQPNNINQTTNQTQTGFHLHRGETQVTLHLWICSKFQQSYLNKT